MSLDLIWSVAIYMEWERLECRDGHPPVNKCHCRMVQHNGKLVEIRAAGQPGRGGGAEYITCYDAKVTYDYCWNNELHLFDPITGKQCTMYATRVC